MDKPAYVVLCDCGYAEKIIPPGVRQKVLGGLSAAGIDFEAATDLCGMSARKDRALMRFVQADELRIVACHPRAVRWLFHAGNAPLSDQGVEVLNMRSQAASEILSKLLRDAGGDADVDGNDSALSRAECAPVQQERKERSDDRSNTGEWTPWFPVIDYDRCTNCKQCLSFCLFGVFGMDEEDRILVKNPINCKTDCPACSRVCPNVAIMFPKYDRAPINGDVVNEEDGGRDVVKVDVSGLMISGVSSSLKARNEKARKRFSTEASESRALEERRQCAERMKADLDIPDKVLASLPIADAGGGSCPCSSVKSDHLQEEAPIEEEREPAPSEEEWGI
ncbi:MAG: ferredoxin family protein [Phycisphaerales bacterium]|nr:MAG: ferredoxin family protein [Phycisphaerales bacterium]